MVNADYCRLQGEERSSLEKMILKEVGNFTPIMLIDSDGQFIYASRQFLEDMEITGAELADKTAYDLVDEQFYDHSPSLKALRVGKDCAEISYSKQGFPVFTETKVLRDEKGQIRYVLCHSVKPDSITSEMETLRQQISYYRDRIFELMDRPSLADDSEIVYQSTAMQQTISNVEKVAKVDTSVLLLGESGVGKDLIAQKIHHDSSRSQKPFIPICIPMISPSLLESELFGYTEGAFTGAYKKGKVGLFEAANGGTVFLDEIGDIPLDLQVKLLRVLENREIIRMGSIQPIQLDIRIVSATNKNLQSLVQQGLFREDLYYRISVVQLQIPPLRQRNGDVTLLSKYFLNGFNKQYNLDKHFQPRALQELEKLRYPGNVRQLRNIIEQLAIMSETSFIRPEDVRSVVQHVRSDPAAVKKAAVPAQINSSGEQASMEDLSEYAKKERDRILEALSRFHGNKKKAAESLGISRGTLYERIRRYNIST